MIETKWIPTPDKNGWWWMLYMGCGQEVSCQAVKIYMIEGKPCVGKGNGYKFRWIPIEEKYAGNSMFEVLGWQVCPEPYFNPDDY